MSKFKIRPASIKDFDTIIKLNLAAIEATARMDMVLLQQLDAWSDYHKVVTHEEQAVAFLLVLASGKPYQSPNYLWFNKHYSSFLYVDRIVVDQRYTGQKIGSLLYQDLFAEAKKKGVDFITCEYNIQPMNHVSHKFHQRHGFNVVATQWLDNNSKQVSLQVAKVK